jgi:copper homeostasis protein
MPSLEIACFSLRSALLAASATSSRIELCANRAEGGTTPPTSWLRELKSKIDDIPIFVMIRPRGRDFIYSDAEFEEMKSQIREFQAIGADGFVFGMLREEDDGCSVDMERMAELVRLAAPAPCTFHRAFDLLEDPMRGLEDVISTGCRAILSSGGEATAEDGIEALRRLVEKADGRILIVAGGGVRSTNCERIRQVSNVEYLHSSAVVGDGEHAPVDVEEVKSMKALLQMS